MPLGVSRPGLVIAERRLSSVVTMPIKHRLLQRQVRKHLDQATLEHPGVQALLRAVEEAYEQQEADRVLIERTMNLSSDELNEAMARLQAQNLAERQAREETLRAKNEADEANRRLAASLDHARTLTREAEAAVAAKSAFLANMSHEIRTPLNAVLGMSNLLIGMGLTGEKRELAETIRSSGDSLLALLNDILDFSKIDAGHMELERQQFAMRECIESALDVLATRTAEKKLDLLYWIDDDVPADAMGDVTRLRQVIVNLLGNAVKFTERGEVFLAVRRAATASAAGSGVRLHFAVHDSGIGIPAERMDRLFKSFSQVDASTTRTYGGTGLGLAICKRLVELMGGRIWVESTAGEGSTFQFEIELGPAPSASELDPPANLAALRGKRLLVVDDNPTQCRVLCLQAIAWGLLPCSTTRANEALAWLTAGEPFDFALVDRHMPLTPGFEFITAVRQLRSPEQLPVILLSTLGHASPPVELGVTAIVAKPVKPLALRTALLDVTSGRARNSAATTAVTDENIARDHPLRVLLVEDNTVNQRVACLMLKKLGYTADIAGNGLEAIDAVGKQAYDVIFMDVQMPEMDGIQATRAICDRYPPGARPRIVAMTANVSTSDRQACTAAGMDSFIGKPVRIHELAQMLQSTAARSAAPAMSEE